LNEVTETIFREIAQRGAISFARFMELALYCPDYGFYEKKWDTIGRAGDFYTSVSVGNLFGELLAFQFAEWLEQLPPGEPVQIVEAGAHNGQLAQDILTWLRQNCPRLVERLQYWIVEPSDRRRLWQQATLSDFRDTVRWASNLERFTTFESGTTSTSSRTPQTRGGIQGIIFSNELLDAFPVHRLTWDANQRAWFECGVTVEQDRFVWTRLPQPIEACSSGCSGEQQTSEHMIQGSGAPPTGTIPIPESLAAAASSGAVLADGFTIEICPLARQWWRLAAELLVSGKLLTFDYGMSEEELFRPERSQGTLRAYRQHRVTQDPLADPGGQDLTCHVNFTEIQRAGEAAGLRTEVVASQEQFLTRIASKAWNRQAACPAWRAENTRQFQTLTHPEHLGRALRVLVQGR
jgi:SAM-dependent MidA family methyltransferase